MQSIDLDPLSNPSKYFYLAQLETGWNAYHLYQKGIEMLIGDKSNHNEISKGLSAQGELFLTDLSDEKDA